MTEGVIFNPATGQDDRVKLRSYDKSFLAPTITMRPGQTVRLMLKNELESGNCVPNKDLNKPKCFDSTNLHSHGLWISPSGNSDNVLLSINPGITFEYEYNVPEDHPAGTFWYHPHLHGSTAVQVASGMAGALIIKGDRPPTPTRTGDIDTLLKPFEPKLVQGKPDYSEVMLFQQIPYACFNGPRIETTPIDPKDPTKTRWSCGPGEVGEIKDFDQQFGPGTWGKSGRYTAINGQVQPTMKMESGRIYRWRLVQAGVRESVRLRISKVVPSAKPPAPIMTPDQEQDYIQQGCSRRPEDEVAQWEIAADGLTRGRIVRKSVNDLQPGYRSDVLLVFPSEGDYCVFDDSTDSAQTVSASAENARLLAWVSVKGGKPLPAERVESFLTTKLIAAADALPANVRAKIKSELKDGLKTSSFIPHPAITTEEVNGRTQNLFFNIAQGFRVGDPTAPGVESTEYRELGRPYSASRIDRTLVLGTAEEWVLTSKLAGHPFHIHVNPFEIVSITWKDGPRKGQAVGEDDSNYAGMLGTWKDTIFVRSDVEIRVRTRYERYIGDFVLHCHILDHEDQGMMQNVRITFPDGKGGAVAFGHDH